MRSHRQAHYREPTSHRCAIQFQKYVRQFSWLVPLSTLSINYVLYCIVSAHAVCARCVRWTLRTARPVSVVFWARGLGLFRTSLTINEQFTSVPMMQWEPNPTCTLIAFLRMHACTFRHFNGALVPDSLVPKLHIWSENMESILVVKQA
jgi:hypothetical protein